MSITRPVAVPGARRSTSGKAYRSTSADTGRLRRARRLLPSLFALQLLLRLVDRDRSTFELVLVVLLAAFTVLGFLAAWRSRRLDRERLPLDDGP